MSDKPKKPYVVCKKDKEHEVFDAFDIPEGWTVVKEFDTEIEALKHCNEHSGGKDV